MSGAALPAFARRVARRLPARVQSRLRSFDRSAELRSQALALLSVDSAAAACAYRELTDVNASHPMHWIGLGLAQVSLSDPAAAAVSATRAAECVDGHPQAHFILAQLQRQLGDDTAAAASASRGVAEARAAGLNDLALLTAASEYAERCGDDLQVEQLLMPLVHQRGGESEAWARLLTVMTRLRGDEATRRLVGQAIQRTGEWLPLHALMMTYESLGDRRRSRLLNRWLVRVWPHSAFHRHRYVDQLIEIGRGDTADAMIRQAYEVDKSTALERAYCERAFKGGEYAEAVRRFSWFVRRYPYDMDAYIALGYALANAQGIDAAERHFDAAAGGIDCYAALVALAHMAMRRRDRTLTVERWAAVNRAYPSDGLSVVEQARAVFAAGNAEAALRLTSRGAGGTLTQHALAEFRVWLLNATGQYQVARGEAQELYRRFGPTWTAAEVAIQTGGVLGELTDQLAAILKRLPRVNSELEVRHVYAILKLLDYFDKREEGLRLLLPRINRAMRFDWVWGYLSTLDDAGVVPEATWLAARQDHAELATFVTDQVFSEAARLSNKDIDVLLASKVASPSVVHIVNMFEQASGGSELHALDLGQRLSRYANVFYWSPEFPDPHLHLEHGVNTIDSSTGRYPQGGVFVFIGVYFALGPWLAKARPERIIILYNTFDAVRLSAFIRKMRDFTELKVELLFCSDMMRIEAALPGLFEPSPIELPASSSCIKVRENRFIIGRHSRDVVEKHGPKDGVVYAALIAQGAQVRLLGATCMKKIFPDIAGLELLPAQRGGVTEFLQGLDVFFYRTGTWIEPWGRVVLEAMALGLPVVAHRRGGYAQAIDHGIDGFLFDDDQQAIELLNQLRRNPDLRRKIGAAARAKAESLLDSQALKRLLAVYLLPSSRSNLWKNDFQNLRELAA